MASIKRIGKDKLGLTIWKVVYRRTPGEKQTMRHLHFRTREEVERAILLDCQKSGVNLKWSEGSKIYLDAKLREGCSQLSMEHVERAVRGWNRMTLLHAAQRGWERAGLPVKKIHEIRHTLGTMASKRFDRRMVQAVMGHQDEESAKPYFHPDEDMAALVRQKIITDLSQLTSEGGENGDTLAEVVYTKNGVYSCPCCASKFFIVKEKGRKSK